MTGSDGRVITTVDREDLAEIARNNNRRVQETGDPATLILGHTADDPAIPEKPAKGFAVNYRVKPFRRDPATGQVIYAIHGDLKVRPKNAHLIEEYPRRSVELWWHKKEIDPIAMLGGTTPERDLSVVIRKARMQDVILRHSGPSDPTPLRFSRTAQRTVLRYAMSDDDSDEDDDMAGANCGPNGMPLKKHKYGAEGDGETDDLPPENPDMDPEGDHEGDDPMVAKVFASKYAEAFKQSIIQGVLEALEGGGEGDMPPGGGGDGLAPPVGAGAGGMPPGGGGMPPGGPDEEERRMHGEQPVQFMSTGFPGAESGYIPTTGNKRMAAAPVRHARQTTTTQPERPAAPAIKPPADPEKIRMQRQINGLVLKLARADAEKTISALQAEGIIFANVEAEVDFLASLDPQAQKVQVEEVYKKNYQRRQDTPEDQITMGGLARYARDANGQTEGEADEFEPTTPMQATELADLQTVHKLSRAEAMKALIKRYGRSGNGAPRR